MYHGGPGGEPAPADAGDLARDPPRLDARRVAALDTGVPADLAALHPDARQPRRRARATTSTCCTHPATCSTTRPATGPSSPASSCSWRPGCRSTRRRCWTAPASATTRPSRSASPDPTAPDQRLAWAATPTTTCRRRPSRRSSPSATPSPSSSRRPATTSRTARSGRPPSSTSSRSGPSTPVDGALSRAPFSNFGELGRLLRPRRGDPQHLRQGRVAPRRPRDDGSLEAFDGWACWSGTSFAAPHVTAAIALHMRGTGLTARQAAHAVLAEATEYVPGVGFYIKPPDGPDLQGMLRRAQPGAEADERRSPHCASSSRDARARTSAAAGVAARRQAAWKATIVARATSSGTGATLATSCAYPSAASRVRPISSSPGCTADSPESHAERTTTDGARAALQIVDRDWPSASCTATRTAGCPNGSGRGPRRGRGHSPAATCTAHPRRVRREHPRGLAVQDIPAPRPRSPRQSAPGLPPAGHDHRLPRPLSSEASQTDADGATVTGRRRRATAAPMETTCISAVGRARSDRSFSCAASGASRARRAAPQLPAGTPWWRSPSWSAPLRVGGVRSATPPPRARTLARPPGMKRRAPASQDHHRRWSPICTNSTNA